MHQKNSIKEFPLLKERREAVSAWLTQQGWSLDYQWEKQPHSACRDVPGGVWKDMAWGFYLANDWKYRLYISHRCTKCGIMVQHSQVCDNEGKGMGAITREVFIP